MTKKEYILLVVRCAANHVMYKKSCSGCDEESLCRKIQTLLERKISSYKESMPIKKVTHQEKFFS